MRRVTIFVAAAVILTTAALLAGVGRPQAAHSDTLPPRVVTATGHGIVEAVPDRATITAGVHVRAATAARALARCSAAVTRVIAALRAAGGAKVQTQQVSVQPQTSDKGATIGFVAENDVSAEVAVAGAGRLIDAATTAGATTIDGPSLSVTDQSGLYRQALGRALVDARAKAEALAKAGGFSVGDVTSVSEQSSPPGPIVFARTEGAAAKATPVEPGAQQVTADVQASFAIG
jgi:uncharacterized protein YggE